MRASSDSALYEGDFGFELLGTSGVLDRLASIKPSKVQFAFLEDCLVQKQNQQRHELRGAGSFDMFLLPACNLLPFWNDSWTPSRGKQTQQAEVFARQLWHGPVGMQ